jgi:3-oxoacyl-[acyl-carrier protein] reductase
VNLGLGGRVALVTGASKGLGNAIARALAAEGAKVAITSRDQARVEEAAKAFGAVGFAHDSANLDGIPVLVHEVEHFLGPIDILVTNTGGPPSNPNALGFAREEWQEAYEQLVLSPMAFVEATMPSMRRRRWGRVLNVVSTAVREPIPNLMLSNAHRSATVAAFKTVARQVAGDGVTLNSLLPGRIATDRLYELHGSRQGADDMARQEIPAGRLGSPDEFAAAAVFLCSQQASYITGVALPVDGGLMRSV